MQLDEGLMERVTVRQGKSKNYIAAQIAQMPLEKMQLSAMSADQPLLDWTAFPASDST